MVWKIFTFEKYSDLRVIQGHWKWLLDRSHVFDMFAFEKYYDLEIQTGTIW